MTKKLLQLFLLFFTGISLSQEKEILIAGQIVDSLSIVKNANIINLKTKQGTFSSDNGNYGIFVSIGDSLQISSTGPCFLSLKAKPGCNVPISGVLTVGKI